MNEALPMLKILMIHNRYLQPGGEDTVVEREKSLLVKQGNFVSLVEVDNDELRSVSKKISAAIHVVYSA